MLTALKQRTRRQVGLAVILALIAGYIDSYALLNFNGYASFMSGNTTQAGLQAGRGQLLDAAIHLLPIPLFVGGVFVGTFHLLGGRRQPVRGLCSLVSACLATSLAITYCRPLTTLCSIILLSFGMGVMNSMITRIGEQRISLGFVTGDLNNIGRHLALTARGVALPDSVAPGDTHSWRAAVLAGVWGSFFVGAMLSGAGMLLAGKGILLPPIFALLALSLFDVSPAAADHKAGRDQVSGQE